MFYRNQVLGKHKETVKNGTSITHQQGEMHGETAAGWTQAAESILRRAFGPSQFHFSRDEKTLAR